MEAAVLVVVLLLAAALVALVLWQTRQMHDALRTGREEQARALDASIQRLEAQFDKLANHTEQKLAAVRDEVEKKLNQTVETNVRNFKVVAEQLGKLQEATGQIVSLSKDVHDLNVLLQAPKSRGVFGEMTLEQMLDDVLGDLSGMFDLQHTLATGERPDAIVYVSPDRSQFVCIDAKFPLANARALLDGSAPPEQVPQIERAFANDVRQHARAIAEKYISPPLTLDWALMFIPAESIHYLLLKNERLYRDVLAMRVVPVSPNSLYVYLRALAHVLRAHRIHKYAARLHQAIQQMATDFKRFATDYDTLGTHIDRAANKYRETQRDIERFTRSVESLCQADITGEDQPATGIEAPSSEPPETLPPA